MKQSKVIIIATFVTIIIILSCAYALPVNAEANDHGELYSRLTVIIEKEQIADTGLWIIYCQDKNGSVWAFYDNKGEWDIGDIANLLMRNVGEREEEDEIIEVYWEGYTDNLKLFFQMIKWHQ